MTPAGGRKVRANGSADPILLTDQMYQVLREKIVMWELAPNDLLAEKRIAEEYSVSRTPVREALALLSQEGMVEVIPRVGYRVSAISLQDVHEIFDMRALLEGEAAARAAVAPATEEQLEALRMTHSQWAEVLLNGDSRSTEYLRFHDAFHLGIAELSGSQRLLRFIGQLLREGTRLRMSDPLMSSDGLTSEQADCEALVEALMEHDAERARQLQADHILNSKARSLRRLIEAGGGRGVHLG